MTEEKVWQLLAELVASQRKTDEQLAKTDAQLAKTDAKLDRIAEMLEGVSNNQGKIAEECFYNSLKQNPVLVGKQFDSVFRNIVGSTRDSQEEYDILLFNSDSVFIIEVKYRVHPKDIDTLIKRKGGNSLLLLPQYRDFQRHLGLATFSIEDAVLQEALDRGVPVLQRRGDLIETIPTAA